MAEGAFHPVRSLFACLLAVCAAAGGASAQTHYRGYDIGPDYGAMLNEMQRRQEVQNQQMRRAEADVVQRAMQDPECQEMYRRHLAGGGQMSFPQFAYQYAATGGFSQRGMQIHRQSEAENQARERAAAAGVRRAEQQRGAAQGAYAEGYFRNQQEAGNLLQGRSSWVDPTTGDTRILPYMGPNDHYDPRTGNRFARDGFGNQWVMTPDGHWYPMAPAR